MHPYGKPGIVVTVTRMKPGTAAKCGGWILNIIAIAAAVWTVAASQLVKDTAGHFHWKWLSAQAAGAAVAVGIPMVRAYLAGRREKSAEQRVAEAIELTFLSVNQSLDPIARGLAEGIAQSKPGLVNETLKAVVGAAGNVIRPGRHLRACYLHAEEGPPRKLVLGEYQAGRVVRTSRSVEIVDTTSHGKHVFKLFGKNQSEFNPDVDKHNPPGLSKDQIAELGYKTFISVPVVAGGLGHGLLTVDGAKPGDLEAQDADVMMVLAGLIAIAMAHEASRAPRHT
jgi:hypothetical protein